MNDVKKYMDEYKERIEKLPVLELMKEWDECRKKINPSCKKWIAPEKKNTMYEHVKRIQVKKYYCKDCKYCTFGTRVKGRGYYTCSNPDKWKYIPRELKSGDGFICFAVSGSTELRIKTSPKWCPLKYVN